MPPQERSRSKHSKGGVHSHHNIPQKASKLSSVDKLVRKNIRQKGKQTADELVRKFMEETQRKMRQKEL